MNKNFPLKCSFYFCKLLTSLVNGGTLGYMKIFYRVWSVPGKTQTGKKRGLPGLTTGKTVIYLLNSPAQHHRRKQCRGGRPLSPKLKSAASHGPADIT